MSARRTTWLIVLGLVVLAGGLRIYRLGDWSFHGDELATMGETASLFGQSDAPETSQYYRLPRAMPLSYVFLHVGYELFGRDEGGSRVMLAVIGTLLVVVVFVGLDRPLGRIPALATALLLTLWPEHLYRSQENRFYMIAAFWVSVCMVLGAQAVHRRSLGWAIAASGAALAALLAHTFQGVTLLGLFVAFGVAGWLARDWRVTRLSLIAAAAGVAALAFGVGHILPMLSGWNNDQQWGFSGVHSIMASISQLGWPIALLALLGGVCALRRRAAQDGYWLVWAGLWALATVTWPMVVVYHPGYVFPLTLGAFVLAGLAIATIHEGLRMQSVPAAYAWLGLAVLLNLPGAVSHYRDGSRPDFRGAAEYVNAHWQEGDRVTTASPTLLKHYLADGIEPLAFAGANPIPGLKQHTSLPGRLWVVVPSARAGKPEALREWLGRNCSQRLLLCKKRFDYYEYGTEVFLWEGVGTDRRTAAVPAGTLWIAD